MSKKFKIVVDIKLKKSLQPSSNIDEKLKAITLFSFNL